MPRGCAALRYNADMRHTQAREATTRMRLRFKETGGIILIKNDVREVVLAIRLSRLTLRKIKQNLFWAFICN